jgi:hypothetical protein
MDSLHPAMRAALSPFALPPINLEFEVQGLRALVKSLKLQQLQNAEFIETIKTDAYRYRHLRDFFALDSDDDMRDFAELAIVTGAEFDAVVDKSRALAHYAALAEEAQA